MEAQRDSGAPAWRRRQIVSISRGGSVRVLGTSRKEERVLTPGAVCRGELGVMASSGEAFALVADGGGGAEGHADDEDEVGGV